MPSFVLSSRCVRVAVATLSLLVASMNVACAGDNWATTPAAGDVASTGTPASSPGANDSSNANGLPLRGSSKLGHEYTALVPPVRTSNPKIIEVTVFSLYACAPCSDANDVLEKWADSMPYFVKVQNSPAVLNPHWSYLARVFFALQAMDQERAQRAYLFRAITHEGMNYADFKQLERWLDTRGVNVADFDARFDSNDVIAQTANAANVMALYHVTGVPTIVIDGRYVVTLASAGGLDRLPAVLSDVVTRVAREKNLLH